jgi:hypothetical protein
MRKKLLNLFLILASLIGYLEWGGGQSVFLFQAEIELFTKALVEPLAVVHPFTLLPVLGQGALMLTLFQKEAGKKLTYFGIGGVGLLLGLMFVIGVTSRNLKILASSLPFLVTAVATVREHRTGSPV